MTSSLRILHLEDDPAEAEYIKAIIEGEGIACEIVRIETRDDFIAAIDNCEFDIVFADYSLPSFDGLSALDISKDRCPRIPFIFVTGKMGEELAIEMLKSGATDYVLKDRLSRLVPSVRRALDEARERAERRKAEEELKKSREELRSLSAHLQAAREEERARIAREIHDELGQLLTALNMEITWLKNKFKDHELISVRSESMINLVDVASETVRKISAQLRPSILDDLGLSAAIRWQAEKFKKRTGIPCPVTLIPKDITLDKDRSTAIFRIFQETLTNVMRHANATRVTVSLEKKKHDILLIVKDNGKGITKEQIRSHQSIGLIGMRERVISLSGELRITGTKDQGTTVTVKIPYAAPGGA